MKFTSDGMVKFVNFEQFPKAMFSIVVNLEFKYRVTCVKFEQPKNAEFPILVTDAEMSTVVNEVFAKNEYSPMVVTLLGIFRYLIESQ